MCFEFFKHFNKNIFIILTFILITNCQLKQPIKSHGINYLENREKALNISKSNKNDVIKLIGKPHYKSIKSENVWFYLERKITRGEMHKLGQNILEKNNILELQFDKYGLLISKKLYTKDDMNKISYSTNETQNAVGNKSFISSFLSSIRQKMYGKRKF